MHVHHVAGIRRDSDGSGRRYISPVCECQAIWAPCPTCNEPGWSDEECACQQDPYRAFLLELASGDEITQAQVLAELQHESALATAIRAHDAEVSDVLSRLPIRSVARWIEDHYSGAGFMRGHLTERLREALAPLVRRDVIAIRAERAIPTLPAADIQLHPEAA